jgi:hypothetical protein
MSRVFIVRTNWIDEARLASDEIRSLRASGRAVIVRRSGIVNTIDVYAVDEAGNRSSPATMAIDMIAWLFTACAD